MKAMKKALALGLALAMVVTAVPVTSAQAASTAKLSASTVSVAAGTAKKQTKSVKVTTPSTWKSVKVTASSSDKKIATVKVSGKTVKVTAVKKGSAKVTVKVSAKKSGKTVKKTLTAKVKVINAGLRFADPATEVVVGESVTLTAKKSPKAAVVTFKSSDDKIATVDADGKVTAVKAGKVTITATSDYGKEVTTDVTVKNVLLQSVKQTKADTLEATIAGDTKSVKATDIKIVNAETNVVYPVHTVSVDAKDATKVTLTVFSSLTDGKNYDVTLDGVTKSFKATDGAVAAISVDPITIPYATEKEIKLIATDAQGVVLKELAYGTPDTNYDFTINANGNGYTNGSKLYLNKVGDTATAEITYKSGKYDQDGKPVGNIGPNKVTITAVDQSAISNFAVRIDDANKASFDKAKDTNKISVGETKTAYFKIKDADGIEISAASYANYDVESSDKTVLMISNSKLAGKTIGITAVKAGTAYILFKKGGNVVNSVAIDVVAEKAVATIELDNYTVTVSNDATLNQEKKVNIKLKDQYTNDWGGAYTTSARFLSSSNGKKDEDVDGLVTVGGNGKVITVSGKDIPVGNYVYKIAYNKDDKEVVAKTLTVVVQKPGATVDSYRLDISETSVDVKVDNDNNKTKTITAKLMGLASGVDKELKDDVTYTVKKSDGTLIYGKEGTNVKTGAAFTIDSNPDTSTNFKGATLNIKLVKVADGVATKNLTAGTYYVTAERKDGDKKVSITSSFTVTDSQTKASVDVKENTVAGGTVEAALKNALVVTYGDDVYTSRTDVSSKKAELSIQTVEGKLNSGKSFKTKDTAVFANDYFTVTKLVVRVEVADGIKMDIEVSVPGTITIK